MPSDAAERIRDAAFHGRGAVTSGGRAEGHAVASTAERRRTNATSGNKVQRITVLSREGKFDATPGRDASQDAARHLLPLTFCPGAASAVLGFMQLGAPGDARAGRAAKGRWRPLLLPHGGGGLRRAARSAAHCSRRTKSRRLRRTGHDRRARRCTTRRHSTAYAATRYACEIRASLPRTNRAADSKLRRFGAEQEMCVPMLAAQATGSTPTSEQWSFAWIGALVLPRTALAGKAEAAARQRLTACVARREVRASSRHQRARRCEGSSRWNPSKSPAS